jgi:hypothetical protein
MPSCVLESTCANAVYLTVAVPTLNDLSEESNHCKDGVVRKDAALRL